MKINFDIECTPEEARAFLGLPNIAPMQDRVLEEMEKRMLDNVRELDPETFVKTWMPATIQGWGDIQKAFWSQMGINMPGGHKEDSSDTKTKQP